MNTNAITETAAAFVVIVLLIPLVIWACHRWQVLDFPGRLTIHARPIPRLGGVAVVLAFGLTVFLYQPHAAKLEWPFFASLALIWGSGLIDDIRGLSPIPRLAAQIIGAIFLWTSGWRVPVPLGDIPNLILTCLFLIAVVNSFNFLDGADGIAAGVAGIIAIAYAVFPGGAGNPFASDIAFGVAGACSGFLVYNLPPAKSFLGDSGSTALGFVITFLALDFWQSQATAVTVPTLLFPFLLCALPLVDAALAIIRRLRGLTSPLAGDRRHVYDLLLGRRYSPVQVAAFCYAITIALAGISWKERGMSPVEAVVVSALSFAALAGFEIRLGSLHFGHNLRRSVVSLRAASNKRAPAP
jgi:UDP-N-acetylmuramyl pentapeptide phosphotransferase/UDP-N-acetylglucosamine-1-phosphate transferase